MSSSKFTGKFALLILVLIIAAIFSGYVFLGRNGGSGQAYLPNPSAGYCGKIGGTYKIDETPMGEIGTCIFPDSTACDSWLLYAGGCPPYPEGPNLENYADMDNLGFECNKSVDCVPAGVSHPRSCVNANSPFAKNGGGIPTEVCLGPLDCGAGRCECIENVCKVVPNS